VDDGSGPNYAPLFSDLEKLPGVVMLSHPVNRGKGAALRSGMKYIRDRMNWAVGIVTADADGQHRPKDIQQVAETLEQNSGALVLGARDFGGGVPFRSALGNRVTCFLCRTLLGFKITDTQTGLRGFSNDLARVFAEIASERYEYELDMLLAAFHRRTPIIEVPIATVYEAGNPSSHFRPLADSLRIYRILFKWTIFHRH
jgi:glycosyltransferase involved in cell wall biosynthesis